MKRKKKATLPRVTVFAMNPRDLLAFVQAVETLRLLVDDLQILTDSAKAAQAARASRAAKAAARKAAAKAAAVPAANPDQATIAFE